MDWLTWGLMPASTAGDHRAPQPIHARAETVTGLPMFAEAFRKRRAFVPATAYFQPSTRRILAQRLAIWRKDGQPLAIAGSLGSVRRTGRRDCADVQHHHR
jgi:putative SOS response-associated peptidase YedK